MNDSKLRIFASVRPLWLLAGGALLFGLLCFSAVSRNTLIFDANLAHVADVGRNFSKGKGYLSDARSDYLAPGLHTQARHPEDSIPLGLPTVMGPIFIFTGTNAISAHLPAVLFFLSLGLATYWVGKKRFGPGVGLAAAFLLWMDTNSTSTALNGLADTGFAVFFLLSMHFMECCFNKEASIKTAAWAGLSAGLAFYMKFNALILPLALAAMFLVRLPAPEMRAFASKYFSRFIIFYIVFLVILAPWFIRNIADFKALSYPNLIFRCAEKIYNPSSIDNPGPLIPFQQVYGSQAFSSTRKALRARGYYWMFAQRPRHELKNLIMLTANYRLLAIGLTVLGLLGGFWGWVGGRREWVFWNIIVGLSSLLWLWMKPLDPVDFQVFAPLAALLAAYFLIEFGKWVWAEVSPRAGAIFGALMLVMFGATGFFYWRGILLKKSVPVYTERLDNLNRWIGKNVKANEAVVTRMPQIVAWGGSRAAIATPEVGWNALLELAASYGARYLVVEQGPQTAQSLSESRAGSSPLKEWEPLFRGEEALGTRKVYSDGNLFYVYRLPEGGGGGVAQ